MTTSATVFTVASRWVAPLSAIPAPATFTKKMGKTATMMVVCTADVAQSYIAQARSSGRSRPRRARRWDIGMVGEARGAGADR
jgi:hypothetical protein